VSEQSLIVMEAKSGFARRSGKHWPRHPIAETAANQHIVASRISVGDCGDQSDKRAVADEFRRKDPGRAHGHGVLVQQPVIAKQALVKLIQRGSLCAYNAHVRCYNGFQDTDLTFESQKNPTGQNVVGLALC
jgi:hypothetical protein